MTEREQELRACLEKLGWDESEVWVAREPDYVELIGATPEDIPFLVGVMKEWLDDREWDDDDEALWAPLHAWRTLAHLGDISAMDGLLAMLVPCDEMRSYFMAEELPQVFRFLGTPALPRLREHLLASSHDTSAQITVCEGITEIGKENPEARLDAIRILDERLSTYEKNDPTLNAHLIWCLCDLEAVEASEGIERAFAADCVDVSVSGNWNSVKEDLGIPGTGLVPEALANKGFVRRSVYVDSGRTPSQRPGVGVGEPMRPIAASSAKAKKKKRKAEKAKRRRGRR